MSLVATSRYDISVLLAPGIPEWPGDTPYSCGWTATIARGSSVNLTSFATSPHVGTHADAPLHVADGAPSSESLSLDAFIGPAVVLDVSSIAGAIELDALQRRLPARTERLLLKTSRTIAEGVFPTEWPALSPECARALVARGLKLLGVDAPSVDDRSSKSLETHRALFDGGAYVLENLDLREVTEGRYQLIALPLRLEGLDAAPVRAVLDRV